MRTSPWRLGVLAVVATLVVGACSQDPTQSAEYRSLEAELEDRTRDLEQKLDAAETELAADRAELADLGGRLSEATEELDAARASATGLEDRLTTAESAISDLEEQLELSETRADDAVAALAEFEDAPWPDAFKDLFIEGCAVDEQGRPDPALAPICGCMVEALETEITLVDFLLFSLATIDPNAELDPATGLPAALDPELVEAVVDAAVRCTLTT